MPEPIWRNPNTPRVMPIPIPEQAQDLPADDVRSARRLRLEHLTEIVHEEMFEIPCEQGTHDTCIWAATEAMDRLEAEEAAALTDGTGAEG